MTSRLPLPWRLSVNATLLLGVELGLGFWAGGFIGLCVVLLFVPISFSGTLATMWIVREIEPRLPGEGGLSIALGLFASWLGPFVAGAALWMLSDVDPPAAFAMFTYALGATLLVALAMRRLVGHWEEDGLLALLAACALVGVIAAFTPRSGDQGFIAVIIGASAYQAIAAYGVGLWLERALARRAPAAW